MTKFEFLGDLSRLIADLPQEEIEQAMEYYEDYFADAGPEKEQEIIRDFISPAYIAEQLREASLQRQKAAAQASVQEEERQAAAARAQAAASKPPVYSRKLAAQAQKNASMATSTGFVTQTPTVKTKSPVSPAQTAASIATAPISGQAVSTPTMPSGASAAPVTPGNPVPPQPQNAPTIQRPQTFGQAGTASQAAAASIAATPTPAQAAASLSGAQTPAQAAASLSGAQTPAQAAASLSGTQTPAQAAVQASASSEQPSKASSMRNSIFRDDTEEDKKKAEEELAKRNKTKVDIKSINSTTSKVNKKQSKTEAKRNAAIEKANNAERYSSSKKLVIGIVLLITCPIWLTLLGVILGVFLLGVCAVAGCILAGIGCFAASLSSIALTLLALLSVQIPTGIFTLGSVLFLFAAGCGLCFLGYKLATRILPGAYFSIKVLFNGIKARLARLALK